MKPSRPKKLGVSVLVVDDDQTMRNATAGILEDELGIHEIAAAENGLVGWRILHKKPYDIVLLDWVMPVMDGYNFVKTVRHDQTRYKTKIIMVTSKKSVDEVSDAMAAGITSYIIKPFEKDTLVKKVLLVAGMSKISPKESEYLEEADKHLAVEEYGKALNSLSKALDVVPANSETRLKLVETLMKKMEYDKAYVMLSEMLKGKVPSEMLRPSSSAMVRLGDVDFEMGNIDESAVKYNEAVAADAGQAEGFMGLGEVALKKGDHALAQRNFQRAEQMMLDVGEDDIKMFNNIAIRHRKSGRPREAVKLLEASLKKAQGNPYLLYNLGRAYLDLDQVDMAVVCLRDALKIDPRMVEARNMLFAITGKDG